MPVPPAAQVDPEASELLRAWIVQNGLHVSLKPGFDDPSVWGILLVDLARHAARAYAAEGKHTEASALRSIRHMFDAEWENATDPGETSAIQ